MNGNFTKTGSIKFSGFTFELKLVASRLSDQIRSAIFRLIVEKNVKIRISLSFLEKKLLARKMLVTNSPPPKSLFISKNHKFDYFHRNKLIDQF